MRLVALDSLRGLRALMVALLHINSVSHISEWSLVRQSWLFVDFFFLPPRKRKAPPVRAGLSGRLSSPMGFF